MEYEHKALASSCDSYVNASGAALRSVWLSYRPGTNVAANDSDVSPTSACDRQAAAP
jgi:hypothetical protein